MQKGTWPYQALVAKVDGTVYLVDSIPAALGAAERAVGVLAGRVKAKDATQQGSASAEIARLESRLAQSQYSVGDLQRYYDLVRLAQYYNFQGRHAEAEKRYREVLALQLKAQITDPDSTAFVLMHIALELSNQERFGEAEVMFERTEALMPNVIDPTLEPQLISYRALNLAEPAGLRSGGETGAAGDAAPRGVGAGGRVDPGVGAARAGERAVVSGRR